MTVGKRVVGKWGKKLGGLREKYFALGLDFSQLGGFG